MSLLFAKQLMKMKVHVRLGFDKEVLILLCYPYLISRRLLHYMEFVHSSMPLHHLEGKSVAYLLRSICIFSLHSRKLILYPLWSIFWYQKRLIILTVHFTVISTHWTMLVHTNWVASSVSLTREINPNWMMTSMMKILIPTSLNTRALYMLTWKRHSTKTLQSEYIYSVVYMFCRSSILCVIQMKIETRP